MENDKFKDLQINRVWYSEGLKFECQRCGACCSGAPGIVIFTKEEAEAMAEELGVSLEFFAQNFACRVKDEYFMKDFPCEHGFDCVMLERSADGYPSGCLVRNSRPVQCRTWPFWPEVLLSKYTWRQAAKKCPGINKGRLYTLQEIRANMRITPQPCCEPPEEECHTKKPQINKQK